MEHAQDPYDFENYVFFFFNRKRVGDSLVQLHIYSSWDKHLNTYNKININIFNIDTASCLQQLWVPAQQCFIPVEYLDNPPNANKDQKPFLEWYALV